MSSTVLQMPRFSPNTPSSEPSPSAQAQALQSTHLLRGQKVVQIMHNGAVYKLQATKLGKLILTK
jgi:hemin uptake protein HemP